MRKQDKRWRTDTALWEKLKPIAHEKRHEPTEAEKELWKHLRMRRLHGLSFRRQHCVGPFIVDLYCAKARLVIEIDGEIHQYKGEEDLIRQEYLESHELKVMRFPNDMVLHNVDEVVKNIDTYLSSKI